MNVIMRRMNFVVIVTIVILLTTLVLTSKSQTETQNTKNRAKTNVSSTGKVGSDSESNERNHVNERGDKWNELKLEYETKKGDSLTKKMEYKVYIYSAYLDTRIKDDNSIVGIRINGLVPFILDERFRIGCRLIINNDYTRIYRGETKIFIHKEHHNKEFVSSTIYCKPEEYMDLAKMSIKFNLSVAVELIERDNEFNHSEVVVKINKFGKKDCSHGIAVCVRPWWGEPLGKQVNTKPIFNNIGLLLEFINAYEKLGVKKIYMYESYYELSEDVAKIIEYYSKVKEIVELVSFKVPVTPFKQVWDFAQTSMIQDCLLRNVNKSRYLIFVDTDEFIFPTNGKYDLESYLELFNFNTSNSNVGALWVPMHFHFLEWDSDVESEKRYESIEHSIREYVGNVEFVLYKKTCRMAKSGTNKSEKARRKVIVRPERILYMGIHEPEEMLENYKFIKSPVIKEQRKQKEPSSRQSSVGLILHHYRRAKGLVNNDPRQKELTLMYANNSCSFSSDNPNLKNQTVVIDEIVWDLFGTDIYNQMLEDLINIKKKEKIN